MHVGITGELLNAVSNKIHGQLRPKDYRLTFGVDDIDRTLKLPSDHPVVNKAIWGEHEHLREQMPSAWLEKLEPSSYDRTVTLRLRTRVDDKELHAHNEKWIQIDVCLHGERDIFVPPKCSRYSTFEVAANISPEVKEFFDKKIEETKFEYKWLKIKHDVQRFMSSNKSLNAALKAWPELRAFIPSEYLERVDRKPERKAQQQAEAERKLAEIDREGAVAAATLAALAE